MKEDEYLVLIIIDFDDFILLRLLLNFIYQHLRQCFIGCPNTSNFVKNTPLRVVFSIVFSAFVCPDETLSVMFDILLLICHYSHKPKLDTISNNKNKHVYYSFKIFSCFWWLVKITRIIYHNQLLLTKFGKKFAISSQWRQNDVKSAARCKLLNHWWPRKPGDEVVLFSVSRKTKSAMSKLL